MRSAVVWVLCIFVMLFFMLHNAYIGSNPGGTNHGEQATHLAITEGFVTNDLNFFRPETRAQNYRADNYGIDVNDRTGITAAHFPVHAYIPAAIQKFTSGDRATIFHWYSMLYGFVGLFFLYLLTLRVTDHIGKSLFVVVFVATAPIFAFHQSNVLPELPGVANVFIGAYFLHRFSIGEQKKYAWFGLSFILLAALSSTYFFFALVAGIILVLRCFRERKELSAKNFIPPFLFLIPLVASEIYFYQQSSIYGSQFAGFLEILEPEQTLHNNIVANWKLHYFTVFQSVVIILFLVVFVIQWRKGQLTPQEDKSNYRFAIIGLLGLFTAFLYPTQLLTNNLFFLQAVFVPITFALIIFVDKLNISILSKYPYSSYSLLFVLLLILISEGNWTQMVRHEKNRTSYGNQFVFGFSGGQELLNKHHIPKNSRISVLVPPNSGTGQQILSELGRNGTIIEFPIRNVQFQKAEEFIVCDNEHLEKHIVLFQLKCEEIGSNGTISLLRRKD